MTISLRTLFRMTLLGTLLAALTIFSIRTRAETAVCNGANITIPFTDVAGANIFFCSIASAYFTGLTSGTTATTYSPAGNVTREQMAAFITRTLDQSLKRGHTRAALGEWWTNKAIGLRATAGTGFHNPRFLASDGLSVWASNTDGNTVSRIDIRTNKLICTLTDIPSPEQMVIVSGRVFITSFQSPGKIFSTTISNESNGPAPSFLAAIGPNPVGITYDGQSLWTANVGTGLGTGSISRLNLLTSSATTFTTGFSQPQGILFDGANLWVTDFGDASLKRVDTTTGAVLQTTPLSGLVGLPVFDGTNLWIPCSGPDQIYVVRAGGGLTGTVLAQLTGNGLNGIFQAAFDGERICVTNGATQSVSLWRAADLSPIASVDVAGPIYNPRGVCSDGVTFFIGLRDQSGDSGIIMRF